MFRVCLAVCIVTVYVIGFSLTVDVGHSHMKEDVNLVALALSLTGVSFSMHTQDCNGQHP